MGSKKRKPSGNGRNFTAALKEAKQNCERFRQAQLSNGDKKESLNDVKEYSQQQANKVFAGIIEQLNFNCNSLSEQIDFLKKDTSKLDVKISRTEIQNQTATRKENQTPFVEWPGKDLGIYCSYWGFMGLTILGGGVCLSVNAISTIPVYIENSNLAWFLLPLPIATVVSTKQFYDDCETDKGKKRLSRFMSVCSLFFFSVWVASLSLMFIGDIGEVDLEQLEQPNYLDGVFVLSQILAEVFISNSLYIATSKIYSKYNPDIYQESKQLLQLKGLLDLRRGEQKTIEAEFSEMKKESIQCKSDMASFVKEQEAMFKAQRTRLEASAPDMEFFQNRMEIKMKQYILIATITLGLLLLVGSKAFARDLIIGISQEVSPVVAKTQAKNIVNFLLDTLQPSDTAMVFNANSNESIAIFEVPNRSAYKHNKIKKKLLKKPIAKLLRFGEQENGLNGNNGQFLPGTTLWPEFLRFIADNYPAQEAVDIILFGSPLYASLNPEMKKFSMIDGAVPGDGHLMATHSRGQTPFGTADSEQLLSNFRIHFALPNTLWKKSDQHAHFLRRFVSLYIERLGGKLISFTHDLPTVFKRVKDKVPAPTTQYALAPTDKLEMNSYVYSNITSQEVSGSGERIPSPNILPPVTPLENVVTPEVPIHERPISTQKVSPDKASNAQGLQVGLSWSCSRCDYDIHAQAHPNAKVLNYSNTSSIEGTYFKDHTSSPQFTTYGYETIAFKVPVDLFRLKLAANFYSGEVAQPVQVEVRISFEGKTYLKKFEMRALRGNKGEGFKETFRSGRPDNSNWIVIDPLEVIGLDRTQILAGRR